MLLQVAFVSQRVHVGVDQLGPVNNLIWTELTILVSSVLGL